MADGMFPLLDLPPELFQHVASFLVLKNLLALGATCRAIRDHTKRVALWHHERYQRQLAHRLIVDLERSPPPAGVSLPKVLRPSLEGGDCTGEDLWALTPLNDMNLKHISQLPEFNGYFDWVGKKHWNIDVIPSEEALEINIQQEHYRCYSRFSPKDVDAFEQKATALGLTIPEQLNTLLKNVDRLAPSIPGHRESSSTFGRRFFKVAPRKTRNEQPEHGYLMQIYTEYGDAERDYLYFDKLGGFAVVGTTSGEGVFPDDEDIEDTVHAENLPELTDAERNLGVVASGRDNWANLEFRGSNVEAWLVRIVELQAQDCLFTLNGIAMQHLEMAAGA